MRIIEQIKWGKLITAVWDNELEQTCGKIIPNYPTNNYIFKPDSISFDDKQLIKIAKLVKKFNDVNVLLPEGVKDE